MLLTYHEVRPREAVYVYSVTRAQFQLHADAAVEFARGQGQPLICFDDGHASIYREALPVLTERKLNAIHFITAGWIGKRADCMSWRELRVLVECGHEIQSHSWSHPFLTQCSDSELDSELRSSKQTLEDRLGIEVDAISMPGGRWDARVVNGCRKAGYRRVFVSDPFLDRVEPGLHIQGRVMVRNTMDAGAVRGWMAGRNRRFGSAWARSRAIYGLRKLIGETAYVRLWRSLGSFSESPAIGNGPGDTHS